MQLSKNTIEVLNNFASMNPNIMVKPGKELRTINTTRGVVAISPVDEEFPVKFCIYDLPRFLKVLGLFEKPELSFTDSFVTIKSGSNAIRYVFAEEEIILKPKDATPPSPATLVQFKMPSMLMAKVLKVAEVLGVPDLTIFSEDGKIYIKAHDKKNDSSDEFKYEIEQATAAEFSLDFLVNNFCFIPGDYDVSIFAGNMSKFTCGPMSYYVAVEATSKY